jgi:LytTr DNA-binding domain
MEIVLNHFNVIFRNRLKTAMIMNTFNWIKSNYKELLLGFFCFGIFIVFEAYQQLFYAQNFSTASPSDITIFDILNANIYRWLIFFVFGILLLFYTKNNLLKKEDLNGASLMKYLGVILAILFLNLTSFSVLSAIGSDQGLIWASFEDNMIFYFFHKTPLYFIMFLGIVMLVHFFHNRSILELAILELGQLKFSNEKLYNELKRNLVKDESFVLQVKTAGRTKLVPVEQILWIEADDYCVRIHDKNKESHTLRSSMKALSQKLAPYGFLRVHRKAIVNLECVTEYVQNGQTELVLNNGAQVPVAQSRLSALKGALQAV